MKKLSICLFIVMMCLVITGCGGNSTKIVTSLNNFEAVLTDRDFSVESNMKSYTAVNYIEDAKVGTLGDIQIEMIEYTASEYTVKVHDGQIESFNLLKSTGAHEVKDKGSNYYRYELISNGKYMISSRVENTLIFCKTSLNNKETVEEIFNTLGY